MTSEKFDIAVIGSGPGGCVAATFLAQKGYKVVMIEREQFPRFHVGESLLPGSQPIWERMGISEKMQHAGHTYKYAGEFRIGRWADADEIHQSTGYFYKVPRGDMGPRPFAYQVERAVFDKQLQDCAVEHGVTLWENTSVQDVVLDANGRATGVILRRKDRETETLDVDFIVDASGRRVLMGRQLNNIVLDPVIRTSAVFGHFRGVPRDPGHRQGFFNGYFIPHGWIWFIPLCHDVMSVGVVQNQPATDDWSNDAEEVMLSTINRYKYIQDRFTNAVQVGRIRRLKDLAYQTTTFCGDGWLSVGDANFFVDPLYSSGVQIAHSTADHAADAIDEFLKGGRDMRALQTYETFINRYRKNVFRPMRCFYRCMRHYKAIGGYVKSTGVWFNHFDNWFLRRAVCWGTTFEDHQWVINLMTLTGNLSALIAPLIGLGGWPRYEQRPYRGPALDIAKAAERTAQTDHDADHVPLTGGMPQSELLPPQGEEPHRENGNSGAATTVAGTQHSM